MVYWINLGDAFTLSKSNSVLLGSGYGSLIEKDDKNSSALQ